MRLHVLVIMAVLTASLFGSGAVAEPDERRMHDRQGLPSGAFDDSGQFADKFAERLGLDDTQRQSVQNIHDAARPEMDALRERMKANRESMRALDENDPNRSVLLSQVAAENGQLTTESILLFDRVRNDMNAVLTDEQREVLASGRDSMARRQDGLGGPRNQSDHKRGDNKQGHDTGDANAEQ